MYKSLKDDALQETTANVNNNEQNEVVLESSKISYRNAVYFDREQRKNEDVNTTGPSCIDNVVNDTEHGNSCFRRAFNLFKGKKDDE
jgi:hypothetical protein